MEEKRFQKVCYFHKKSIVLACIHIEMHFKIEQLCNVASVPMATWKETCGFLAETRLYREMPKIF